MNRKQLISVLHASTGIATQDIAAVIEGYEGAIVGTLAAGEVVRMRHIGSFRVVERAARRGRNPKTGEAVDVPARKGVKFSEAPALKEAIQ